MDISLFPILHLKILNIVTCFRVTSQIHFYINFFIWFVYLDLTNFKAFLLPTWQKSIKNVFHNFFNRATSIFTFFLSKICNTKKSIQSWLSQISGETKWKSISSFLTFKENQLKEEENMKMHLFISFKIIFIN